MRCLSSKRKNYANLGNVDEIKEIPYFYKLAKEEPGLTEEWCKVESFHRMCGIPLITVRMVTDKTFEVATIG